MTFIKNRNLCLFSQKKRRIGTEGMICVFSAVIENKKRQFVHSVNIYLYIKRNGKTEKETLKENLSILGDNL